jgi:hypothetical protein
LKKKRIPFVTSAMDEGRQEEEEEAGGGGGI